MGDECNVLSNRMEDPESFAFKEHKKEEKESHKKKFVRESPSGEPGEDKLEIPEVLPAENFPEILIMEPLYREPEVGNFCYVRTKLRPDAPPFTPECVTPIGQISYREPEVGETHFVNVDLKSQNDQLIPEAEGFIVPQSLKEIKDPTLKPFCLTSTPVLKQHVSEVNKIEEEDAVVSIPMDNPPTDEVTTMPSFPDQSRNSLTTFLMRNRIQIAVIMASLAICGILIVYVVV